MSLSTLIDLAKFVTSSELQEFLGNVGKRFSAEDDVEELKELNFRIQKNNRPKFNDCIEMLFKMMEQFQYSREASAASSIILSETVDNALRHGCARDTDSVAVQCRFTVGGTTITVRQPQMIPAHIRGYQKLNPVTDWEIFNRESALGWQNILYFSDHLEFPDAYRVACSIYKTNLTISEELNEIRIRKIEERFNGNRHLTEEQREQIAENSEYAGLLSQLSVERTAAFQNTRIVRINGRVDHTNSDAFLSNLDAMSDGDTDIIVDLGGLEFITSAGLRAMLLLQRKQDGHDRRLAVSNVHGVVREVFRISKFDALLKVYPELKDAIADFAKPS